MAGAALLFAPVVLAQDAEIRAMLKNSEANWNRGDLVAFAADYEDSPGTTFVGKEVTKGGNDAILARYRRSYPTRDAMGTLTFSEIEVRPLAPGLRPVKGIQAALSAPRILSWPSSPRSCRGEVCG